MKLLVVLLIFLFVLGGCTSPSTDQQERIPTAAGVPLDDADLEESLDALNTLEKFEAERTS